MQRQFLCMCGDTDALNEARVAGGNCPGRTITQQRELNRKVWQRSPAERRLSRLDSTLIAMIHSSALSRGRGGGRMWLLFLLLAPMTAGVPGEGCGGGWGWLAERRARTILFKHQSLFTPAQHNMHHASRAHTGTHTHTSARLSPHLLPPHQCEPS